MAVRREAVAEIGFFDEALDGGTLTMSGGDQEFFYRVLARGFRIVYEPAALVWHCHRRTWGELKHTLFGYGVGLFAWWTCALVVEKETTVLFWGGRWFVGHILGELLRSLLKRPGYRPLDLALAEFNGAIRGPWRYFLSRRMLRKMSRIRAQSIDGSIQVSQAGPETSTERVPVILAATTPPGESGKRSFNDSTGGSHR
jgi:hypothetical protein